MLLRLTRKQQGSIQKAVVITVLPFQKKIDRFPKGKQITVRQEILITFPHRGKIGGVSGRLHCGVHPHLADPKRIIRRGDDHALRLRINLPHRHVKHHIRSERKGKKPAQKKQTDHAPL